MNVYVITINFLLIFTRRTLCNNTVDHATSNDKLSFRGGYDVGSVFGKLRFQKSVVIDVFTANRNHLMEFEVDSTVTQLDVDIVDVDKDGNCTIESPANKIYMAREENGSEQNHNRQISVSSPVAGRWKILCTGNQTYKATIRGESDVDFTVKFINNEDGTALYGNPIKGLNMTLAIEVLGMSYLKKISRIQIRSTDSPAQFVNISEEMISGREQNFYHIPIRIPKKIFRIGIEAVDRKDDIVHRLTETLYHPQTFKFDLSVVSKGRFVAGSDVKIRYAIHNYDVVDHTYNIRILLNTLHPDMFYYSLPQNKANVSAENSSRGIMYIKLSSSASPGSECDVIIKLNDETNGTQTSKISLVAEEPIRTSHSTSSHTADIQTKEILLKTSTISTIKSFITTRKGRASTTSRNLTTVNVVHTKKGPDTSPPPERPSSPMTDIFPPAYRKLNFIDRCSAKMLCSTGQWIVVFTVQDNESGIHKIQVQDEVHSSVTTETFQDGLANTPIHGNISTSCCKNEVVLIVEDMVGNVRRFPVQYEKNVTNSGDNSEKLELKDISVIVVGLCAGILTVTIIVTLFIQFRGKLVALIEKVKHRNTRRSTRVELRVPYRSNVYSNDIEESSNTQDNITQLSRTKREDRNLRKTSSTFTEGKCTSRKELHKVSFLEISQEKEDGTSVKSRELDSQSAVLNEQQEKEDGTSVKSHELDSPSAVLNEHDDTEDTSQETTTKSTNETDEVSVKTGPNENSVYTKQKGDDISDSNTHVINGIPNANNDNASNNDNDS